MANSPPFKDSQATSPLAVAVTPHDSTNFTDGECRALYVGVTGNVVGIVGGVAITFVGAQAGSIIPVRFTRINNSDTTAGSMVALY